MSRCPSDSASPHAIVLFDGVCNFCNASVNWIIRRDKRAPLPLRHLQPPAGERLQREHGLHATALDTMLLSRIR